MHKDFIKYKESTFLVTNCIIQLTYMQGLILSAEVMVAEIEKEGDSYHFQIHHVSRVPNPFVLKPKGNLPLVKK